MKHARARGVDSGNYDCIPPQTEGAHQSGSQVYAGFSNVQHVTSLAKDRIDHAGGSTIEPPIEVNTSARGSYRISLRREVTCATLGSVAWKCSWWCLVLLRAGGKGTMDQDVTEVSFSPMDAQGLVVKYVRSGWVFSQNAKIRQEDFLNLVVTGMKNCAPGALFPIVGFCVHGHFCE